MNPSANSTVEQGDLSWSSQTWDHNAVAVCCGLDSRYFQPNRQDWDWENAMILAQHSNGCVAGDQEGDYKPNIMQAEAIGASLRQYNGLLSASINPSTLPHNAWGMLNAPGVRNAGGFEGSSPTFPASSTHHYAGLGASGINGFSLGNGSYGDMRSSFEPHRHLLGLVNLDQRRLHDIVKRELCTTADFNARIGLNLGGRTYFSAEDCALGRFGKRLRPNSPGAQAPLCQAEGCKADLSIAKHYHRRHKVCEFHSKAATVMISGQTQRFCQQCSRFHVLSEFDDGKRSCRKRLADHNRRRRKPQPSSSTCVSSTIEPAAEKNNEQEEQAAGSDTRNDSHSKGSSNSDQPQSLLSAMSLAPSAPALESQEAGKRQLPAVPESNVKEAKQNFMQGSRSGPSLSLTTLGGGSSITTPRQSSGQNFGGVDLSVPWLRPSNSRSSLMETVTRPAMSLDHVVSDSSPNGQLEQGGSSAVQDLRCAIQDLLPLQLTSRDHGGSTDWVMKSIAQEDSEHLEDFGSQSLSLDESSEGQEVLSLLERGNEREVQAAKNHNQQTGQGTLGFLQQQLPSTGNVNGTLDSQFVTGSRPGINFPGLQALRPLNRSIFSSESIL